MHDIASPGVIHWTRADSEPAASGWSQLHTGPHGRRTARRPDPAWTQITLPSPGPLYGVQRHRAGGRREPRDGQRRQRTAPQPRPLARVAARPCAGRDAWATAQSRKDSYTYCFDLRILGMNRCKKGLKRSKIALTVDSYWHFVHVCARPQGIDPARQHWM
jgi:hypothetical protein